jgi:hypothetical protein
MLRDADGNLLLSATRKKRSITKLNGDEPSPSTKTPPKRLRKESSKSLRARGAIDEYGQPSADEESDITPPKKNPPKKAVPAIPPPVTLRANSKAISRARVPTASQTIRSTSFQGPQISDNDGVGDNEAVLSGEESEILVEPTEEIESGVDKAKEAKCQACANTYGLYDNIYCSAHYNQCSLIIRSFLAAWRSGCGPTA